MCFMTDRTDSLAAKLDKLRRADRQHAVFGASSHHYQLNNPVDGQTLDAVEASIGHSLPDDYREFITRVGDGGAGPFYGLLRLTDSDDQTADPSEMFPYSPDAPLLLDEIPQLSETVTQIERARDAEDDDVEEAAFDKYYAVLDQYYQQASRGIKFLAHEGCGMYDVLIVNGPQAGTVWFFDFCNDFGVVPINHPSTGAPMSFADWYEYWLDVSLADHHATPSWFA